MNITKKEIQKCFPTSLKYFRKRKGMTQQHLADFLLVSKGYISSLEIGRTIPNLLMICQIADVLGTTPEDILKKMREEILKSK